MVLTVVNIDVQHSCNTLSLIISKIGLAIRFFRIKFITNTRCFINNISVQLHQRVVYVFNNCIRYRTKINNELGGYFGAY